MPDSSQLAQIADPFYPNPDWATPTTNEWTLVEIKGGMELSKINLSQRPCWLLGRAADQVHIPMQHPSISRCHARIAFDQSGTPWLRDCKSTHGVFVNKKRLPPEAVGVEESNSTKKGTRGVVLYPGDVIQLGASTRLYCVEGPEQFQRGRIRLPPPKPKIVKPVVQQPQESDPAKEEEEKDDAGVSWGISMAEAADYQDIEEESMEEAMKRQQALESNVPEKHRKAWEKIQALKYKLQNIQTENERIRRKGELTQGQENQLKRNAEREQQLGEQILEREKELYDKINPDNKTKKKRSHSSHAAEGDDDDVDDFFDRTKNTNDASNNGGDGETEESLLAKYKDLKAQQTRKEKLLERAHGKVKNLQQRLDHLQATGDDDAFFAQNDLTLAKEQRDKLENGQVLIDKELEETKRLLKIVNPNIVLEEQKKVVDDGDIMPPPMLPPPSLKAPPASPSDDTLSMMPPPMMPPPKRARVAEPAASPSEAIPAPAKAAADVQQKPSSTKGKMKGPARGPLPRPMGTLAALTAASSVDGSKGSDKKKPATTIDMKKDEWRAPKDQDGSGITKLNAKFAGRY